MLFFPNAKVNLGLNVVERRSDGFHNIETLFVPVPDLCDILEVLYSDRFEMVLEGLPFDGAPEDNICVRAYELLSADFDLPPVRLILYKNIPVGAGLGGGSADGAFTLMALNRMCSLGLTDSDLAGYAARLGSDSPFFIYNRPMLASGRGDILTPFDGLEKLNIKVYPQPVAISTRQAYAGITPARPQMPVSEIVRRPPEEWKDLLVNDFEKHVFAAHPELARAKAKLYDEGALYVSMSGSGSALYAVNR